MVMVTRKGEAQVFLDRIFRALGHGEVREAGPFGGAENLLQLLDLNCQWSERKARFEVRSPGVALDSEKCDAQNLVSGASMLCALIRLAVLLPSLVSCRDEALVYG